MPRHPPGGHLAPGTFPTPRMWTVVTVDHSKEQGPPRTPAPERQEPLGRVIIPSFRPKRQPRVSGEGGVVKRNAPVYKVLCHRARP